MNISELREKIDTLDDEIVSMINQRIKIAFFIGIEKRKQKLPVLDKRREAQVFDRLLKNNISLLGNKKLTQIFKIIMRSCKEAQKAKF